MNYVGSNTIAGFRAILCRLEIFNRYNVISGPAIAEILEGINALK